VHARKMMDFLDCDTTDPCDIEVFNLNSITDEKLRSATLESLETGKITPLLKEELKCRILTRCLEEGKELSPDRSGTKITPRKDKVCLHVVLSVKFKEIYHYGSVL